MIENESTQQKNENQIAVRRAEMGFAQSMKDRNFSAFQNYISDEAIFISGSGILKGKPEILKHWITYFETADPPFSWKPNIVESLPSGDLAISTGPVFDTQGNHVANFTSTWRKEISGQWKVVFDKGDQLAD